MEEPFKIEVNRNGDYEIVKFCGNIDAHAEPQFDVLFRKISTSKLTMDFSQTGRINSMGIAFLLRSIKKIKTEKNANVSISGLNQVNAMLFKMTGIFMLAPEIKPAHT
jgi:anti-anti-sigma factor